MATYGIRALDGRMYDPNPSQRQFFRNLNDSACRYTWYAGGMGAGKTLTGCVALALEMLRRPRGRFVIGRWAYRELLTTTWDTLCRIMPRAMIVARNESPANMMLALRNGAICYGWNLSNWKNLASLNLDGFYCDELHEVKDPNVWFQLCARLRGTVGPLKGWGTGTPAGRDWAYQLFVEGHHPDHRLVRAPTRENLAHLPPDYEAGLRRIYTPEMASRFLDADFSEWEGLVLASFREAQNTIDDFPLPSHWNRFRAIDPGYGQDPAACLWGATDEEGNLYLYDEWKERGKVIREQAEAIHLKTGGAHVEWTVIDPSSRRRNDETGRAAIDLYRSYDLPCEPAENRIEASIHLLNNMLSPDPERIYPDRHARADQSGAPQIYFLRRGTAKLREEIRHWLWDGDKPTDKDNHLIDCLRYLALRKPHPSFRAARRPQEAGWKSFWEGIGSEAAAGDLPLIGAR